MLAVTKRNINTDSLQVLALIVKIRLELALKVEAITKLRKKRSKFSGYYNKLPQKPSFPGWSLDSTDLPVGDSGNIRSKDVQLKVYCRKAVEKQM